MSADTPPEPPPEALLIERRRADVRPRLSVRAAAGQAGLSESRWRQIAKGYQAATADLLVPVSAPADTLARMALAVGATSRDLEEAGRLDAARELSMLTKAEDSRRMTAQDLTNEEFLAEMGRRMGMDVESVGTVLDLFAARNVSAADPSTFGPES